MVVVFAKSFSLGIGKVILKEKDVASQAFYKQRLGTSGRISIFRYSCRYWTKKKLSEYQTIA
jgi:hypothetical protein